jgi:hypothetical protein
LKVLVSTTKGLIQSESRKQIGARAQPTIPVFFGYGGRQLSLRSDRLDGVIKGEMCGCTHSEESQDDAGDFLSLRAAQDVGQHRNQVHSETTVIKNYKKKKTFGDLYGGAY